MPDYCHVHLCADDDPWPCWLPPGPQQPHLSTRCGWQSVYPAGSLRPYFEPLTHTNENPDRLFVFLRPGLLAQGKPTATDTYTIMSTCRLQINSTHAGPSALLERKHFPHRSKINTHAHKQTHAIVISTCLSWHSVAVLTPWLLPYGQWHTALH